MKQKFWSMTLCLFIMAGLLFTLPQSASAETEGIYEYFVSEGKATIIGCDMSVSGEITVPDTLGGYPVTDIGKDAFSRCYNLTSITIGNDITEIGDWAFSRCTGLTSITIGSGVTSIARTAFSYCIGLTNIEVNAQNSCFSSLDGNLYSKDKTTLIQYAYGKTDASFAIPNGVITIGDAAFYECENLISVTIPNSVISIGEKAFCGCYRLTSVTIPDSVTYIGEKAFSYCKSLTSVTIPDSVTYIGNGAFYWCNSLTSVTIGNSVTTIGDLAFSGCESLTTITIPDSVTTIGDDAFLWCYSLTTITIPDGVTAIGDSAFYRCNSLTSITMPSSITSIDEWAFYYCCKLTSVTIPNSVTYIGEKAFCSCYSLTSVTIPDSVTSIGKEAFSYCKSLTDVYYAGTEEEWSAISIGTGNNTLTNATIHFGASDTQPPQLRVMLNNQEISFDVPPQIVDGRTVVPLRAIFEALGATVIWDASTRTILAEKAGTVVRLTIDEKTMYVNGKAVELDVAAMIVDGRTLVPVRAISESFDCSVAWDGNTRTVFITE